MTPIVAQPNIHARAVLVGVRISSWTAKKFDREVTEHTTAAYNTDASAGRFNKSLLPSTVTSVKTVERKRKGKAAKQETVAVETNSHKELIAHIAATRVWAYQQTLPWDDNGWLLLPMANYQKFMDGWRERERTYRRLYAAFMADYPKLVADARRILNGMFKESDYPSDITARFAWDIDVKPVPSADFRVSLSAGEIKSLTANVEARITASIQAAQNDAIQRLFECVSKIQRCPNRSRENARELCDILTRLNITDDSKLDEFRRQTELLASVEPDPTNDTAAVETANRAQSILDAMTATYGKNLFGGK